MNLSNLSEKKLIKIGLKALCERWPSIKTWSTMPNWALLEIGASIIESEENWGKLVYLSREVDRMIDEKLEYNEELYYTRVGKGYVYDDGAHAQYGELDSIMTLNN
jgi:hypothetical protein